ncbi:MAG: hypothetical protein IPL84_10255 [Chitinophagaceae bacterium]|nr:hypothetical protein [Chitinophagaceae bacterium]
MKTGRLFLDKKMLAAAIIYFSVGAWLLFRLGINTGGEAQKFIDNANRMINGEAFFNGSFGYFYIAYTGLVAFFIKLSVNLVFVGFMQLVLSFLAGLCLYKIILRFSSNTRIAFLFFIVYLFCYPVQKWNFYVYSESLHISFLVIGSYLFLSWLCDKKLISLLLLGPVLLFVLFSRPVGLIFCMSLLVVLLVWLYQQKKRVLFFLAAGITLVSLILILNSPYTAFINPDSIRRMEIICQVPEISDSAVYHEYNREGLYQAFAVIKNEVGLGNFFKAGFKKLGYFFGLVRNYYSWYHNLLLIVFTVLYPFALIGIFSKPGALFYYPKLLAICYLLFTAIGIFFTCDEWSNRFIGPAFPFILILAAGGVFALYKKKKNV